MLLTAVLLAAAAAPPDAPAEALFRKMEKKLLDATTFSVKFAADIDPKKAGPFKGRAAAAAGGKFRVEVEGKDHRDMNVKMGMVSDGVKVRVTDASFPGTDNDAKKEQGELIRVAASRTGLIAPLFLLVEARSTTDPPAKEEAFDREKYFAVSGFKLGAKMKTYDNGGSESQAVEYQLRFKSMKEPIAVTVWIDTATHLPVKRVLTVKEGETAITITETYTDFTVGGKADDKDFVLPK